MAEIRKEIVVDRPPDEVWAVVGDPVGLVDFFPQAEGRMEGDVRVVAMGGLETRERILSRDDDARRYDYEIVAAPFEFTAHRAWMKVEPEGDASRITWVTTIEPDELEPLFGPAFDDVLKQLKAGLEPG